MISYYKDDYIFRPSKRKNKKYDVFTLNNEYITSFGDKRYQQYYDHIGFYKDLNHYNKERQYRYFKRHGTAFKFESAGHFSAFYLWR